MRAFDGIAEASLFNGVCGGRGGEGSQRAPLAQALRAVVVALSGAFFRYSHLWFLYGFRIGSDRHLSTVACFLYRCPSSDLTLEID